MSRSSSPILISSRDSTPSPTMSDVVNADLDRRIRLRANRASETRAPSSSPDLENAEMNRRIRLHRLRAARPHFTPSPPSSSPDERTNDGALGLVVRTPRMSTSVVTLSAEQIRQNALDDTREYHDERIDQLAPMDAQTYSRTFMHAAMISHWATLFRESVSTMLVNFRATPSIAIPAVRNLDPPPIFPTASGSGTTAEELELEYPPDDDDWEVQSVESAPALPVLPPHHHIHATVLEHLHTLHVDTSTPPVGNAPPIGDLGANREPITPTDPVPSMPSSPPQFLQADPLDAAPPFEQIINALVQRDVDAQVERIAREEAEEGRTPTPTGPQTGTHPGPGWAKNCEDHGINYVFLIPTDPPQRCEIAPFVTIDWNTASPELLGTRGRGYPVHSKPLHARADEFPRAAFDRRQEFFFADHQTHSDGVDWAMRQEGDDTLRAEVIRHRAMRSGVIRRARQVADLREQLADERIALAGSTYRLARANGYRRLRRHITNSLTPTTSDMHARQISRIKAAVDSPWNYTDEKLSDTCLWCKREGHKVEYCALIRVCELCRAGGHLEEGCFQPHTRCVSFEVCRVPLDHKYRRRHACPSTVVIERS